jgi:hypothetical protein
MKTLRDCIVSSLILLVAILTFSAVAFGADAPVKAAGLDLSNLWQAVIPVAVPLLIVGLKFLIPMVPGWLLPIIAPVLGGLADAVIAFVSGGTANPVLGAILGSAGVGLREVVDQLKKAGSGK